jgi:hypothetical protein
MELIITEKDSNVTLKTFVSGVNEKETININSGTGVTPKQVFSIDHLIYDKNSSVIFVDDSDDNNKFVLGVTVGILTIVGVAATIKIFKMCKK